MSLKIRRSSANPREKPEFLEDFAQIHCDQRFQAFLNEILPFRKDPISRKSLVFIDQRPGYHDSQGDSQQFDDNRLQFAATFQRSGQ